MKFLVVDDSPTMRRVVKSTLQRIGYDDAVEAEDGIDGLRKLKENVIDFVITDWNMPNLNGLEFVKVIRSRESYYQNIPILMITTRGNQDDVLQAIKVKVNNYIVKPFTPYLLNEKIDSILKSFKK